MPSRRESGPGIATVEPTDKPAVIATKTGVKRKAVKKTKRKTKAKKKMPKSPGRPKGQGNETGTRQRAMIVYTTDPTGITKEQLRKLPAFQHLSRRQLEDWSMRDGWSEHRKTVLEGWQKRAEQVIGSEICQQRLLEVRELRDIQRMAIGMLKGNIVEVKSWEGLLKAALSLNERLERLSGSVVNELIPRQQQDNTTPELKSSLTDEEQKAAIAAVLGVRREAQTKRAEEQTEDDVQAGAG